MLVSLKNMSGNQIGEVDLDDSIFAAPVNNALMHQALVRQLANARLGTHKTKGRSEVSGGGRKPWRQKGTGRARQGSTRSPNWVGGGIVFGPRPRKYTKSMPRKMRRSALRSALSVKADAGQIFVVDQLTMDTPKTKAMIGSLNSLGLGDGSVLMVVADKDPAVQRSANNLPNVKTLLVGYLNVRDLLGYDSILFSVEALESVELWLAEDTEDAATDSHGASQPALSDPGETAAVIEETNGSNAVDTEAYSVDADGTEDGADSVSADVEESDEE